MHMRTINDSERSARDKVSNVKRAWYEKKFVPVIQPFGHVRDCSRVDTQEGVVVLINLRLPIYSQ